MYIQHGGIYMFHILLLLVVFVLLFIPIPIKISVKILNNKYYIYVYGKELKMNTKNEKSTNKHHDKKDFKNTLKSAFKFINRLKEHPFKPTLKLKINLNYGLDDAALTGITYGFFNALFYSFFPILNTIFKIKCFNVDIHPLFNEKKFYLCATSIIYINIVKIIYIVLAYKF